MNIKMQNIPLIVSYWLLTGYFYLFQTSNPMLTLSYRIRNCAAHAISICYNQNRYCETRFGESGRVNQMETPVVFSKSRGV